MKIFELLVAGIFGLAIGSFLNVIIYRLPKHQSIILPASHCPKCQHQLAIYDNIPVLSYLILAGRCRYCKQKISFLYPLIEISSSVIVVVSLYYFGLGIKFVATSFFLLVLLVISAIDLQHKIIPNLIILPAIATGIGLVLISQLWKVKALPLVDNSSLINSGSGFLIGGGLLLVVALARPGGMGGGDIKLAAFLGIFLGRYVLVGLFIGFLIGSIVGLIAIIAGTKSRKSLLSFGPYLALGAVITIIVGQPLVNWYLQISRLS
jgi:leader peptidase (prepilin peptidase)/N-methyltransferase